MMWKINKTTQQWERTCGRSAQHRLVSSGFNISVNTKTREHDYSSHPKPAHPPRVPQRTQNLHHHLTARFNPNSIVVIRIKPFSSLPRPPLKLSVHTKRHSGCGRTPDETPSDRKLQQEMLSVKFGSGLSSTSQPNAHTHYSQVHTHHRLVHKFRKRYTSVFFYTVNINTNRN